jgi:hypothetical protein
MKFSPVPMHWGGRDMLRVGMPRLSYAWLSINRHGRKAAGLVQRPGAAGFRPLSANRPTGRPGSIFAHPGEDMGLEALTNMAGEYG